MKKLILSMALSALSGCASFQEGFARGQAQGNDFWAHMVQGMNAAHQQEKQNHSNVTCPLGNNEWGVSQCESF